MRMVTYTEGIFSDCAKTFVFQQLTAKLHCTTWWNATVRDRLDKWDKLTNIGMAII